MKCRPCQHSNSVFSHAEAALVTRSRAAEVSPTGRMCSRRVEPLTTMNTQRIPQLLRRLRSEDGVSLIHVGMVLLVLMGFSTFVLDYGVLWLARGQAQNAADAGALAGAIARGFDETANPPSANGAAYQSAYNTATSYSVFG